MEEKKKKKEFTSTRVYVTYYYRFFVFFFSPPRPRGYTTLEYERVREDPKTIPVLIIFDIFFFFFQ